jgi:RNA polymerase sigma-70 factor (ECF subfamily)
MHCMPVPAPLDPSVVAGFRDGDDAAVRKVYRAFAGLVFSVAMRVLDDRSLAEEVTQQTFLQAWRGAAAFEDGRDLAPWLATIARRCAIDAHRKRSRRPAMALADADPTEAALVTLPPSADQLSDVWQVRSAIESLPAGEQEIVRLQHLEGCTHIEIAERLGIAVGTVKSRSFRAHKSLLAALGHLRHELA